MLIVPPVEVIPYATLAKAKEFFEAGGVVVGYGFLPSKSATLGKTGADIAAFARDLGRQRASPADGLQDQPGRRTLVPALRRSPTPQEITATLAGDAGVHPTLEVLEGKRQRLAARAAPRRRRGRDVFFVCNQNHQGAARQFRFRATAAGEPECWDAMRNEITAVPFQRIDAGTVEFSLTMEPLESMLMVFQSKRVVRPMRIEPGTRPLREPIVLACDLNPTRPEPLAAKTKPLTKADLAGGKWIWFPEGNPAAGAPPASTTSAKRLLSLPIGRSRRPASCSQPTTPTILYVNGNPVGNGDDWKQLRVLEFTQHLQTGPNVLAIAAINGGQSPNPAGLLGRFIVDFEQGPPLTGAI